MKTTIYLAILGATFAIGACEQSTSNGPTVTRPAAASIDDALLEIARETGLTTIDVSVPFERLSEAPARLQRIADVLNSGSPGLYVMRYQDDTLRNTYHIFAIRQSGKTYIELTSIPTEQPTRVEFEISTAAYDEPTKTLTLQTRTGSIRLTPTDVTSVGA